MTHLFPRRGTRNDHKARVTPPGPPSGRRGARFDQVTCAREERPVDTMAVARKVAEEKI
jgi:hypothetical protein